MGIWFTKDGQLDWFERDENDENSNGDTVEFRIYHEQGSAVSYNQSNTLTWWMGYLIG